MSGNMTIEIFNAPYFMLCAATALIFALPHLAACRLDRSGRSLVLTVLMLINIVIFIGYKLALSRDFSYSVVLQEAGLRPFNWWNELPIQLCNINMIMIPVGLSLKNQRLLGFSVYSGTLGALMALLMPSVGFTGVNVFMPRILGFYITHWAVFFGSLSLLTLGLFKPNYKEIPRLIITFCIICTIIFAVNMLLRVTGLSLTANYWFNVMTEGNPLLELFHKLIPVPLLYMAPAVPILAAYMLLVVSVYNLVMRLKSK